MKETDKAYLAGIMDGEGYISLLRRSTYYVPTVKIVNTNEALINRCKEILDLVGLEYGIQYQDRGERTNAKPAWVIVCESRPRVVAILELIYPYLVCKKPQADLVLEWCSQSKRSPEETELVFLNDIRDLNKRGRVK